jgi:hypothetical protein
MDKINLTENFKIKLFGDYISYGVKVFFFHLWLACSLSLKKKFSWSDDIKYNHKYSILVTVQPFP